MAIGTYWGRWHANGRGEADRQVRGGFGPPFGFGCGRMTESRRRARVLFFGEPVTLAHVARPIALARSLDPEAFDVALATGRDYRRFVEAEGLSVRELFSVGSRAFLRAVAAGRPVFPYAALERYVQDDLRHIREFQPDVVVGDFRISLAVSARLVGVRYIAISNAYWSLHAHPRFEIPVHLASRILGPDIASAIFRAVRPLVFAQHSLPMHRLCRMHGRKSLGFDLRRVFTEGDVTLFADIPELVPAGDPGLPAGCAYLGPVTWSPRLPLPDSLRDDSDPRPLVYVTMGSSGDPRLVKRIVEGLEGLECRIALATAGVMPRDSLPKRVISADYLPGDELSARASLVICNGGSLTCYQALQHGVPVLGLPANLDQLLNMYFMERAGVALRIRADRVSQAAIRRASQQLVERPEYRAAAQRCRDVLKRYDSARAFGEVLREALEAAA